MHTHTRAQHTHTTHTHHLPPGLSPLPSPAATPGVYTQFTDLHSRLVVLLLKCQELAEKFKENIDHLEKELHSHRERFVADLSEVEVWLAQVYSLLCQEPAREVTEGYGDPPLESETSIVTMGAGREVEMRDTFVVGGGRERVKYPSEPCSFDSVDGNLITMMEGEDGSPFDKQVLNSSVDIALEDEEYEQEVLKRVLSPVEGEGEEEEETVEQEMEGEKGHVDPLLYTLRSSQHAGGSLTATTVLLPLVLPSLSNTVMFPGMQYGSSTIPGQRSLENLLLSQHKLTN